MLGWGIRQLEGTLRLELRGGAAERFLTRGTQAGVVFRAVERVEIDRVRLSVSPADFFRLRRLARNCGVTLRVLERHGLPFAAGRLLRHRVLAIGLVLAAALVVWMSGRVWTIRVEGCAETSPREILMLLSRAGLKTGVRRRTLPLKTIKSDVISGCDKLSRLTINFRGIHACVTVWERRGGPEAIDESAPCSVAAPATGIVLRLRVRQGSAAVRAGDTVQAGELLASGWVAGSEGTPDRALHAIAEADIRTWDTLSCLVPGELCAAQPGDAGESRVFLRVGERIFPLGFIENPAFLWYDVQIKRKALLLHPDQVFPLLWCRAEPRELCAGEPLSEDALAPLLERRMTARLLSRHPGAVLAGSRFSLERTGTGAFRATLRAELVETGGIEVPLEARADNPTNQQDKDRR